MKCHTNQLQNRIMKLLVPEWGLVSSETCKEEKLRGVSFLN